ncbi:MAG: membrane protein insertase YidC, partial [Porphyromonadaceae bacterium]|nr:membrane protein insertase YidC [Porphyromonadaceae bacterium]
MDKNTLWGLIIIGVVILGFSYFNQPSPEQRKAAFEQAQRVAKEQAEQVQKDSATAMPQQNAELPDSLKSVAAFERYGILSGASVGQSQEITLKNDLLSLRFDTKGGMPIEAQLLKYKAQEDKPLYYFTPKNVSFNLPLMTVDNR